LGFAPRNNASCFGSSLAAELRSLWSELAVAAGALCVYSFVDPRSVSALARSMKVFARTLARCARSHYSLAALARTSSLHSDPRSIAREFIPLARCARELIPLRSHPDGLVLVASLTSSPRLVGPNEVSTPFANPSPSYCCASVRPKEPAPVSDTTPRRA